jgi:hypothetical protein
VKVLLPDAQGVLPNGVDESPGIAKRQVLQNVDAETVHVVPADNVLIDPNQNELKTGVRGQELLKNVEVALDVFPVGQNALTAEELVPTQLAGPDGGVGTDPGSPDHRPVLTAWPSASRRGLLEAGLMDAGPSDWMQSESPA